LKPPPHRGQYLVAVDILGGHWIIDDLASVAHQTQSRFSTLKVRPIGT
jgi:hypothetical protein